MPFNSVSPVLVKEIRQGLKSRSFAGSFVIIQLLMMLCILLYLTSLRQRSDVSFVNGLFWFFLSVPLVMVLPLRGFQTIHEEVKNKTLELIFLTRLSAWQIVFGKWLALFVQGALIVVAVMPYLVLRYFLGGINLVEDLWALGSLFLSFAILLALGVGLSAIQSRVIRIVLIVGAVFSLYLIPVMMISWAFSGGGPRSTFMMMNAGTIAAVSIGLTLLLVVFLLEFGASLIAPPAENHALRKRALGILLLASIALLALLGPSSDIYALALLALVPIGVDALVESARFIPVLYRPSRFPPRWFLPSLMRMMRGLFYPGWPSGVLYVLALMAVTYGVGFFFMSSSEDMGSAFVAQLGALLFPLAAILLIRPNPSSHIVPYLVIQLSLVIFTFIMYVTFEATNMYSAEWIAVFPLSYLMMMVFDHDKVEGGFFLTFFVTAASVIILLVRMRMPWTRMRVMEKMFSGGGVTKQDIPSATQS